MTHATTGDAGTAAQWGTPLDEPPDRPLPDPAAHAGDTARLLERMREEGLRVRVHSTRDAPKSTTLSFGEGSGWVWGTLTVSDTGHAETLRAFWTGDDDRLRVSTTHGEAQIHAELERHVAERTVRLVHLVARHGLYATDAPADCDCDTGCACEPGLDCACDPRCECACRTGP